MSDYATINVHRRGGAATIELNRPETMNAWNFELTRDLRASIEEVAADDSVRAICLTGAGRAFSSGVDLRDESRAGVTPDGRSDLYNPMMERFHPVIAAVRAAPKPVVAAVNGPAVGIGLSLAMSADLVVARESAYFLLAFVNIGLAPDGGASALVAERIGLTRAAEFALLGDKLPATRAAEWGLINRVVADDAFEAEVDALVDRLAGGAVLAQRAIKRQLNQWSLERLDAQMELEARLQQELGNSADFAEGVASFLERRPAEFQGR
jgi:2-(1,2-epoxy-1,2-dihydrophenyl)acetyl-CoA isomerase